ncbi:MAG: hypothetical protein Kow001_17160 [Acidobacteriota bacterium]
MGAVLAVAGLVVTTLASMLQAERTVVTWAAAAWFLLLFPLSGGLLAALAGLMKSRWIQVRHPGVVDLIRVWPRPVAFFAVATLLLVTAGQETGGGTEKALELWLCSAVLAVLVVLWLRLATQLPGSVTSPAPVPWKAVGYLLLFLPTFWLVTDEWFAWFSPGCRNSLGGFYHWAGLLLLGTALLAWRETAVPRGGAPGQHFRDLSRFLLFASCFWLYAWFCRYLPVWYTGLPGESSCLALRAAGSWAAIHWAVPVTGWLIPCALLLPGRAKSDPEVVRLAAGLILVGRWLDVYGSMVPAQGPLDLRNLLIDQGPLAVLAGFWWTGIPGIQKR